MRPDHKIELVGGDTATTSLSLLNPNGSIDTQFGTAGTVTGLAGNPFAAFEQKGGKIVVATDNTWDGGTTDDVALVRYGLDGKPDDSYGYHGVTIDPLGVSGPTNAVALQSDKKILDAGSEQAPVAGQPTDAAMVRYNPDGTLDTSFGSIGRVMVQIGLNSSFTSVAVAADRSIYAAATGDNGSATSPTPVYALYRFKANGTLDKRFGVKGRAITDGAIQDMDVLPNGDVLAITKPGGGIAGFISRYLPDGRLDPQFGTEGRVSLGMSTIVEKMLVESDGSILEGNSFGIVKYTAAGQRDTSFGSGGGTDVAGLDSMALAPNGDIVAASSFLFVTRLLPDGTPDPSFATAGMLSLNNTSLMLQTIQGVVVQSSGEIVVGAVQNIGGPSIGLVGIDPTGNVDPTFSGGGQPTGFAFLIQGGFGDNPIPALIQQPDGNFLVATNSGLTDNALDTPSRLFRVLGS